MSAVERTVYAAGSRFVSRVNSGRDGETITLPVEKAIEILALTAELYCQVGPERWTGAVLKEGGRCDQMFAIGTFTNVDCDPNPFTQKAIVWKTVAVPSVGPFTLELWKSASDERLFARIGFAVQFPVFYQRICMITLENAKEVVARELRIISKEMYNPKLDKGPRREVDKVSATAAADAARKRRREAPDYDPSKEYTGPPALDQERAQSGHRLQ